ncbi:hypothetical protein HDU91_002690 [Kappamyces sp. JEL0680]|nr:hypothetical protein HDU91_002690 [Kappamyces sp. JEL0680]
MSAARLVIDFTSDPICPFCYLGWKKIEAAMKQLPQVEFEVRFHPFMLDPALPSEGIDKMERYRKKFGASRMGPMVERVKSLGKEWGIEFAYSGLVANTLQAHRLIWFAEQQGLAVSVKVAIMKAYHELSENLGDANVLAECYARGGGNRDEARAFLASSSGLAETEAALAKSRMLGISGVPFIVVNDKYAIEGAQEPSTFKSVFEKVLREH